MDPAGQTSSALFQRRNTQKSTDHDAGIESQSSNSDHASQDSSPHETSDLEKMDTVEDLGTRTSSGAHRATSSGRISRIQSLQRRRTAFDHPLSHVKTNSDVVVDFDGPDDPYR